MGFSWSTFRRAAALAVWLGGGAAGAAPAAPESIRGRGLVAGQVLFLFGEVHRCGGEQTLPEAQSFVSTDGGQSWQKRGPALSGSEILFARAAGQELLAAGEHTAEGPATDPFVIGADGQAHTIADGPGELLGVTASGQELTARVRASGAHGQRKPAAKQTYVSHDGGRTWSAAAAGARIPGGSALPRVSSHSGGWRLVDRKDGGFELQKRDGRAWTTVRPFPWTACPE